MFSKIIEAIKNANTVIIHRHERPDGDAIGCQIGLKEIIKDNFPNIEVYAVGDDAKNYSFMIPEGFDTIADEKYSEALAIVLDCGSAKLISDTRYAKAKDTARIDHHIFCEKICNNEVIDTSYESCCGMIADMAVSNGLIINSKAATALYTGMVTDSGRFRYDSTSPRTLALASKLLESKVDFSEIFRNLYADTYENKKLKATFLLKVKFTDNNVAYIYTDKSELASLKIDTFTASRGMVNTMSDIKGVEIWVNFTETDDGVFCEIRSSVYNINPIAVKYGGGGHAKASGCTLKSRDEAMMLLADLNDMIGAKQ